MFFAAWGLLIFTALLVVLARRLFRAEAIGDGMIGNVWAWRSQAARDEKNWWDVVNDAKPDEEALARAAEAAAPPAPSRPAVCLQCCLHCGELVPAPKVCGSCKFANYCSQPCQKKHWQTHKPACNRLVAADRERAEKGLPRPAPPTPDPPLELPSEQLVFSAEGYRTLLQAHRAGLAAAAAADDPVGRRAEAEAAAAAEPLVQAPGPRAAGGGSDAESADGDGEGPETNGDEGVAPKRLVPGSPDGAWRWSWPAPPSPLLLTPPRPAGIANTGNSCYAAAALQALLATPALGEYLRSGAHAAACGAKRGGGMEALGPGVSSWCPACELSQLAVAAAQAAVEAAGCAEVATVRAEKGPTAAAAEAIECAASVDARGLTRAVHRLNNTLIAGRQEDAHELLLKLLEALAEVQLAEAGGRTARRAAHNAAVKAAAAKAAEAAGGGGPAPPAAPWRGDESSLVQHCFGGYLRRATICDCCGHVSQTHQPLQTLEVELTHSVWSVEGGLRAYFADEVLDEGNQYRCERCRQLVCATLRRGIEVAPNVLAVTLMRFTSHGARAAKNNKQVHLKLGLDLAPHMAAGALDGGPTAYRLFAVVQHGGIMGQGSLSAGGPGGSLNMGHYVAVVRGADGRWYRCDDDEVELVREEEVAAITDAYMLLYERLQPRLWQPEGAPGAAGAGAAEELPGPAPSDDEDGRSGAAAPRAPAYPAPLHAPNGARATATAPEWAAWLQPDAAPPPAQPGSPTSSAGPGPGSGSERQVLRPRHRLMRPRAAAGAAGRAPRPGPGDASDSGSASGGEGGSGVGEWTLVVELPGVKRADVKIAATYPTPAEAQGAQSVGAHAREAGRVRVWAAGSYSLDVRLWLRRGPGGGVQLVAAADGEDGGWGAAPEAGAGGVGGAVGAEVEVGPPRWRPTALALRVPMRVRAVTG